MKRGLGIAVIVAAVQTPEITASGYSTAPAYRTNTLRVHHRVSSFFIM
jgi:hypothetical protein